MPIRSMIHLNNNLLCAIAIKTTGKRPYYHDLYDITIYPLDSALKPTKILPFSCILQLKREYNLISKKEYLVETIKGIDPWCAADMFEEWMEKLELPLSKRIVPLCINWGFQRNFIMDWLNEKGFKDFIYEEQVRDIQTAALYLNDRADFHTEPVPFAKTYLQYLCSTMRIERLEKKSTLWECHVIAQIYQRLCSNF